MRASRLLSTLMLLQARGRMSAPALAAAAGVSVRTVYRDIDELSAAGVPVTVERGARGGFELLAGWRTRLTGLTADESQALFLGGLSLPARQLGLGDALRSAQHKLMAALPASGGERRDLGVRFHFDPVGWYQRTPAVGELTAIAAAVWRDRRIAVRYESWKGVVDRELEPLGLVLKAADWYLVARAGRDVRTYRVANVRQLVVREQTFVRPRKFNLEHYWAASLARFEKELYRGSAQLRVTAVGLARLRGFGAAVAAAVEAARQPPAGGRVRVRIPIESIEHAAQALLALGAEGEVLAPPELRARMADTARVLTRLYRAAGRRRR